MGCSQLNAAWSLPEEQKHKAIKRLFLQYHPDKNPSQHLGHQTPLILNGADDLTNGTEQHLHIVITDQETGAEEDHQEEEAVMVGTYPRHRQIRLTLQDGSSKLSMITYASLCTLMSSSQADEKTCASTCFMCHEVAEKSLKAGMYSVLHVSINFCYCTLIHTYGIQVAWYKAI